MFCTYCGQQNDDNNAFCTNCGKTLKNMENSEPAVKTEAKNQQGTANYQGTVNYQGMANQATAQQKVKPMEYQAEYYPKVQTEVKSMGVRFTAVLLAAITIITMLSGWIKIHINSNGFESEQEKLGFTELSIFEMTKIASELYDMYDMYGMSEDEMEGSDW